MNQEKNTIEYSEKYLIALQEAKRRRRYFLTSFLVPIPLGALIFSFLVLLEPFGFPSPSVQAFIILTAIGISASTLLMRYLQSGFPKSLDDEAKEILLNTSKRNQEIEDFTLQDELFEIKADIAIIKESAADKISEKIKEELNTNAALKIIDEVRGEINQGATQELKQRNIDDCLTDSVVRLEREIVKLNRKGDINLAVGGTLALIGIYLLSSNIDKYIQNPATTIYSLAPQFSLVLVIEIFAFFFLGLYKTLISEIKYFQNELTNIDFKRASLFAAQDEFEPKDYFKIIKSLSETERNFVLKKNQTTVELEKNKSNDKSNLILIEKIEKILGKQSKD